MPIFDTTIESKIASMEAEIKGLRDRDQRNMAHLLKVLAAQTAKINAIHGHVVPQKNEDKPAARVLDKLKEAVNPVHKPSDKHATHKPKHK